MNAENKPSKKGRGWSEIGRVDQAKMNAAIRQVCALRDLHPKDYDVTVTQGLERWHADSNERKHDLSVTLQLTQKELKSAPRAVRRVLRDIGIKFTDGSSIELSVPAFDSSFQFTLRPAEITDDRLGITLSTIPGEGAVIAPVYRPGQVEPPVVEAYPFTPSSRPSDRGKFTGQKAYDIRHTYRSIAGDVDGNGLFVRNHPYMIEILTSSANWAAALIADRIIFSSDMDSLPRSMY